MNRVFLDTNVILDICLNRVPFVEDAAKIFKAIEDKKIIGVVSSSSITDIYYLAKRQKEHESAVSFIINLIDVLEIIGVDKGNIEEALRLNWKDFEDAVQYSCSKTAGVTTIVTRNIKDFAESEIPVFSPNAFVSEL